MLTFVKIKKEEKIKVAAVKVQLPVFWVGITRSGKTFTLCSINEAKTAEQALRCFWQQ